MKWMTSLARHLRVVGSDLTSGFMMSTHNSLAMIGMLFFVTFLTFSIQPQWRQASQAQLLNWLQFEAYVPFHLLGDSPVLERVTAANPRDLPSQQARLVQWLARKYRVAPEPLSAIVSDVFDVAPKNQVDPWLVIAVIAVDSNFNPFFQGPSGKLGLMQYQPEQASSRTSAYGGAMASFDPLSNVRMGLAVLKDSLLMAGTVREGLKLYSGEYAPGEDELYVNKVLAEYQRLVQASTLAKQVPEPVTPYLQESVAQGVESWGEQTWRALMEWLHLIQTATPPESGS
ncbi:MAG: lytic transglycosylase domain-containing protein [Betaproteobacteria bacterium]|jgi:Transglycosylase SLT domain|nr:lytic transglycosylase domain-containing protein [Betaproteobacteria bacterium]NBP45112.1 lytic transglycosylase domain-containing protein [Betaproteobacteria bacterium]